MGALLGACSVDATVYGALPIAGSDDASDAGTSDAGMGAAGTGGAGTGAAGTGAAGIGGSPAHAVFGCGVENPTGPAILEEILTRLGSDLLMPPMSCSTDSDCARTLIFPRCDQQIQTCAVCTDPAQQALFGTVLGLCLADAGVRCCNDPNAAPDCILRACEIRCGGQ